MQEKTTNLTASMQGTLYEANFKNRHPCGTLRRSFPNGNTFAEHSASQFPSAKTFTEHSASQFPSGNTFAEHSASQFRVEIRLRNTPQVNSEWKHIYGTLRKQV